MALLAGMGLRLGTALLLGEISEQERAGRAKAAGDGSVALRWPCAAPGSKQAANRGELAEQTRRGQDGASAEK